MISNAALSGLAFFGLLMFCFPGTSCSAKNILLTALFTATLGIVFLLAIQWIADFTQRYWVTGRGIIVLVVADQEVDPICAISRNALSSANA